MSIKDRIRELIRKEWNDYGDPPRRIVLSRRVWRGLIDEIVPGELGVTPRFGDWYFDGVLICTDEELSESEILICRRAYV